MKKLILLLVVFSICEYVLAQAKLYNPNEFNVAQSKSGQGLVLNRSMIACKETVDYVEFHKMVFQKAIAGLISRKTDLTCNEIDASYQALALYNRTKDKNYLYYGEIWFENYLKRSQKATFKIDQFDGYPFYSCVALLKEFGRLSTTKDSLVRIFTEKNVLTSKHKNFLRFGNRELGRQLALVCAAYRLYPNDPAFAAFRSDWEAWWNKQKQIGVLDENSGNYSSLGLTELLKILTLTNKLDDLKTEAWRQQFTIYRDLVTPSGNMPEFGDDYFEHGGKIAWVELFEFASRFYDDPSFAVAAHKLFNRHQRYFNYWRLQNRFSTDVNILNIIPDMRESSLSAESVITYRKDQLGKNHIYNMILRPNNNPGSPMLMLDLYGLGDHAHMDKRSSILNYEVGNVMLLHGFNRRFGRQTWDGGNGFSVMQYGNSFPIFTWPANNPLTVSIPAERFGMSNGKRIIRNFTLDSGNRNNSDIQLSNIRLEGTVGIKVLDSAGIFIPVAKKPVLKDYNYMFDPSQYSAYKYEATYSGGSMPKASFRYAEDSQNQYNAWHGFDDLPLHSNLGEAKVENKNGDSFGFVDFTEFGSLDSRYTRQIVLTQEGVIVIREDFTPGKSIENWTAGLTWQFYSMEKAGINYFASKLDEAWSCVPTDTKKYTQGMLAIFDIAKGDSSGVVTQMWNKMPAGKFTFFSRFKIVSGKREIRTQIVIPYSIGDKIDEIVSSVNFKTENGKSEAYFVWKNTNYVVSISDNNKWAVARNK